MQTQVNALLQLPFHHLKVADLREILKTLGLKRSGNKESLIENLKLYLREISQSSDINSLTEVAGLLDRYLPKKSSISHSIISNKNNKNPDALEESIRKEIIEKIHYENKFKEINFVITPFIKPIYTLYCGVVPFELTLNFSLNKEQSNLFHHNNNRYRILLYCSSQNSAENSIRKGTDCPIQYPCQPVLKINEVEVTGMEDNIKKHNKSWSTKPVDITAYCKKKGIQNNMINEIRFRSMFISSKWNEFVVKIIICEYLSLQEVVNGIKKHFISKEELLRQRLNLKKSSDDEIETTSSIVSLRCPISKARIKIPCRFKECTHVQCFDISSYLQLNEQSPNWKCPVCNTRYDWKSLVIDGYMQDILNNVSSDVNSVTVEVNGTWHIEETHSPLNKENHYESEEDEEEDRFLAKLEAEIKGENNSVIDLTLSDDDNKSTKSTNSTPNSISSSLTTSLQAKKVDQQSSSSSELEQLNSHPNRKRTIADLIAPHRKKVNGKPARLIFENTKTASGNNNINKISTSGDQRSSLTSSYFNSDINTNNNSDQSSLDFLSSLHNTTTSNLDHSSLLSTSLPLSTDINYSLNNNTSSLTPMNIDSSTSLNNIINIDESDNSNHLSSIKNKNTLASKSLNISAKTNTLLDSSKFPYSSLNSLKSKLPDLSTMSSLNHSSLNFSNTSDVNVTANSSFDNESSSSLDIFNSNRLSGSLGINQNSLTIPTSLPSTKAKSSSITIPMSSSATASSSSLNMNTLNSFIDVEDNPYNSLLKSVLLNQSSKVSTSAPSSPSINKSSLKLESHTLTNSLHMSPKPSSISLSAQSSPGLGRTPAKFKNISPKPPKLEPSSLDFTNYYNLLTSLNYSNPLASTTPSSLNLSNPSLTLANNSLPLNNTTDPTTLLYLNTLANNSLINSNVSQLATPPPVPNYFDPTLLASLQSNPYNSLLFGNNYALSMASSMVAPTGSNVTSNKIINTAKESLASVNPSTTNTNTNTISSNLMKTSTASTSSTAKALEKLLKEAAASTNLTTNPNALSTSKNKTTPITSSAISSLTSNSINPSLNSALLNTSLLSSTSLPVNTSTTTLLNSLNSSTTSTSDASTLAFLNSLNVGSTATTSTTPSNNISAAALLNSLNSNLSSTTTPDLLTTINKLSSSAVSSSVSSSTATPLTSLSSFDTNTGNLASLGTYQGLTMNPLMGLIYTNSELYNQMLANNSLATPTNPLLNSLVSSSSLTSNTNSVSLNSNNKSKK